MTDTRIIPPATAQARETVEFSAPAPQPAPPSEPTPTYLGEPPRVDDETHICSWCGDDQHGDSREHHREPGGYYADELAPIPEMPEPTPAAVAPAELAEVLARRIDTDAVWTESGGFVGISAEPTPDGHLRLTVTADGRFDRGEERATTTHQVHIGSPA